METIKVNMTPCEDIKTIHASQNDNEAREWGFELHNNGEKIDSSSISDQLVFKAYEGGTEEILPTNGSTPTTSPFKGDIKYPQGLLSDQEFLYRESPTEEDGLAWIKNIKGNTLVWKQLVPSLSAMSGQNGTISVANNVATITSSSSASYLGIATSGSSIVLPKGGHKYLLTAEVNSSKALTSCNIWYGNNISAIKNNVSANTWTKVSTIASYGTPSGQYVQLRGFGSFEQGDTMQVRNWNYFDLTAMGLDSINTIEEFTSLFHLPYYAYNQGTLLSFNGNGIKTVGKNLVDAIEQGAYSSTGTDVSATTRLRAKFISVKPNTTYSARISGTVSFDLLVTEFSMNDRFTQCIYQSVWAQNQIVFTTLPNCYYVRLMFKDHDNASATVTPNMVTEVQLEKGSAPSSYEPYTSSTLSLPISTYFPNGMKSAGSVYDELTETKAITRVSYNTITRSDITSASVEATNTFRIGLGKQAVEPNNAYKIGLSNKYTLASSYADIIANDKTIGFNATGTTMILHDSSLSTVNDLYTMFSSFTLEFVYPLVAPTETPFTTASLVTENAEIPLSNEDGVLVGKCNINVSADAGFIEGKIKLSDEDGDVYSNKIQIHVERSPQ